MAKSDESDRIPHTSKPIRSSISGAIEQIERGLAELYASASVERPATVRPSTHQQVRMLIEARRIRFDVFPPMLFSDPAWDILLELYARQLEHRPINVSRLTAALPVPETTILRWIGKLEREAMITRRGDPHHAKRIWIELSQYGRSLMDRYFEKYNQLGLP